MPQEITEPRKPRASLLNLVASDYPVIAGGLLGPLMEFLSLARTTFGGDTDKFLIMLAVAIRTVEHEDFAASSRQAETGGSLEALPSLGTNIRSIAESIGAPRETIRRKVAHLVREGWIVRRGNDLNYSALAYREFTPLRLAAERLAVRNYEVVDEVLRRS